MSFAARSFPAFPLEPDLSGRKIYERTKKTKAEKVPSVLDLREYLKRTGRTHLCENLFACDPWRVEPSLLHELNGLRTRLKEPTDTDAQTEINKLRALMRAGSVIPLERVSDAQAITAINPEHRLTDPRWKRIERVFQDQLFGDETEQAVRDIEDLYGMRMFEWIAGSQETKRILQPEIEHIRRIRDKLYLRRLYPELARKSIEVTTILRREYK